MQDRLFQTCLFQVGKWSQSHQAWHCPVFSTSKWMLFCNHSWSRQGCSPLHCLYPWTSQIQTRHHPFQLWLSLGHLHPRLSSWTSHWLLPLQSLPLLAKNLQYLQALGLSICISRQASWWSHIFCCHGSTPWGTSLAHHKSWVSSQDTSWHISARCRTEGYWSHP